LTITKRAITIALGILKRHKQLQILISDKLSDFALPTTKDDEEGLQLQNKTETSALHEQEAHGQKRSPQPAAVNSKGKNRKLQIKSPAVFLTQNCP